MLVGKHPSSPIMKRTTSNLDAHSQPQPQELISEDNTKSYGCYDHEQRLAGMLASLSPTPHFLRSCGLCNSRLAPGRDIYMYRGDTAFCSLECREKQIKQDHRKEKWKVASNKENHHSSTTTATAKASNKTETVAACT